MSVRQEMRKRRLAAHFAAKRATAGNDPGRLCAVEFDTVRALINSLPLNERGPAYRHLTEAIRTAMAQLTRR